jgi:hypothetical protein
VLEYLKVLDLSALALYGACLAVFSVGVVCLVMRASDIMDDRKIVRQMAARRRSMEQGARGGWDCLKLGPFHYIPEGVTKGGGRVR